LASGSAADLGRTRSARLRCFGNSIVLPLARTFVEAVIAAFADAAQVVAIDAPVTIALEAQELPEKVRAGAHEGTAA
jgi:predicted nuclease with RNAse H fold